MLTTAKVVKTEGVCAIVEVQRKSACEGCHKMTSGEGCGVCSLMGSDRQFTARAENRVGAEVGDVVEVSSPTGRVLFYSALVFLLPVVVGILLYAVSGAFFEKELYRYVLLVGGFVACFFGVWLYSRLVLSKRCDVEIVRICGCAPERTRRDKDKDK